ncbi:hypothetical protein CR513_26885, partial [Mucuna pruriens]
MDSNGKDGDDQLLMTTATSPLATLLSSNSTLRPLNRLSVFEAPLNKDVGMGKWQCMRIQLPYLTKVLEITTITTFLTPTCLITFYTCLNLAFGGVGLLEPGCIQILDGELASVLRLASDFGVDIQISHSVSESAFGVSSTRVDFIRPRRIRSLWDVYFDRDGVGLEGLVWPGQPSSCFDFTRKIHHERGIDRNPPPRAGPSIRPRGYQTTTRQGFEGGLGRFGAIPKDKIKASLDLGGEG